MDKMKRFILASASPRRRDILKREGFSFEVIPSDKEGEDFGGYPEKLAVEKAIVKAEDVFGREGKGTVVLGADTVVFFDGRIIGKPADAKEAEKTLKTLSGNTHEVVTGYALIAEGRRKTGFCVSKVEFNDLSEETIRDYIASGLWKGKAGAYGIQDGFPLVKGYEGDRDNIVGLPVGEIKESIEEFLK